MSRWVKFNAIIFMMIVVLALLMRFLQQKNASSEVKTTTPPAPTTFSQPSSTATTSGVVNPEVLGLAVQSTETTNLPELTVYESKKLLFMVMLPENFIITNDVLTYQSNESVEDQSHPGSCTFTTISKQQHSVIEERTLEEFDLPLVVYKKLGEDPQQANPQGIYLLKNEENTPKLELHCTSDWQVNETFYTILRSVRFN